MANKCHHQQIIINYSVDVSETFYEKEKKSSQLSTSYIVIIVYYNRSVTETFHFYIL